MTSGLPDNAVQIVISGPGMNALGTPLMQHLLSEVRAAGDRPLLLVGDGRAFSAGLDLKEVLGLDQDGMRDFLDLLTTLTQAVLSHPAPTVAAVYGHAIAGGAVLARACDTVVTSHGRGRIGLNEVALGLRFPPDILAAMANKLPPRWLTEVVLGAQLHDGQSAVRVGLADYLCPVDDRDSVCAMAAQLLTQMSSHPADAFAHAKRGLQRNWRTPSDAERADFDAQSLPVWVGEPIKNRIRTLLRL